MGQVEPSARRAEGAVVVLDVGLPAGLDVELTRSLLARVLDEARAAAAPLGGDARATASGAIVIVFAPPLTEQDPSTAAARTALSLVNGSRPGQEEGWLRAGVGSGELLLSGEEVTGAALEAARALARAAAPRAVVIDETTSGALGAGAAVQHSEGRIVLRSLAEPEPVHPALLLGREKEAAAVTATVEEAAQASRCMRLLVLGTVGMGKTRLVEHALAGVGGQVLVARSQCYPTAPTVFGPLIELVRQVAGVTGGDDPAAALRALLPPGAPDRDLCIQVVGGMLGGSAQASGDSSLWAVRKVFEAAARRGKVVLLVDDLHWASEALLDAIEHLTEHVEDVGLTIICAARPEVLERRPSLGWLRSGSKTLVLGPLPVPDGRRLVRAILPDADPALVDSVVESTQGNPLFVAETAGMLAEMGLAERSAAAGGLHAASAMQRVITARLHALDEDLRAVAQAASVVGSTFDASCVAELLGQADPGRVLSAFARLAGKEVIERQPGPSARDELRFRHEWIREALYEMAPKGRRADLHEGYARLLPSLGDRATAEETTGYHLERAVTLRREIHMPSPRDDALAHEAAQLLASAGRREKERGDAPGAASLLERAYEVDLRPGRDRANIALDLAEVSLELGQMGRARDLIHDVATLALQTDDELLRARAAVAAGWLELLTESAPRRALVLEMERIAPYFEREQDHTGAVSVWRLIAEWHWMNGNVSRAEDALRVALQHSLASPRKRSIGRILGSISGGAIWGPIPVAEGLAEIRQISGHAPGHRLAAAELLMCEGVLLALQGEGAAAAGAAEEGMAILHDLGRPVSIAHLSQRHALVHAYQGDLQRAEEIIRSAYVALTEIGETGYRATCAAYLAAFLYELGRTDEVPALLDVADTTSEGDPTMAADTHPIRAHLAADRGDADGAVSLLDAASASARGTDMLLLHGSVEFERARVFAKLGWTPNARSAAREAVRIYSLKGATALQRRAEELAASL